MNTTDEHAIMHGNRSTSAKHPSLELEEKLDQLQDMNNLTSKRRLMNLKIRKSISSQSINHSLSRQSISIQQMNKKLGSEGGWNGKPNQNKKIFGPNFEFNKNQKKKVKVFNSKGNWQVSKVFKNDSIEADQYGGSELYQEATRIVASSIAKESKLKSKLPTILLTLDGMSKPSTSQDGMSKPSTCQDSKLNNRHLQQLEHSRILSRPKVSSIAMRAGNRKNGSFYSKKKNPKVTKRNLKAGSIEAVDGTTAIEGLERHEREGNKVPTKLVRKKKKTKIDIGTILRKAARNLRKWNSCPGDDDSVYTNTLSSIVGKSILLLQQQPKKLFDSRSFVNYFINKKLTEISADRILLQPLFSLYLNTLPRMRRRFKHLPVIEVENENRSKLPGMAKLTIASEPNWYGIGTFCINAVNKMIKNMPPIVYQAKTIRQDRLVTDKSGSITKNKPGFNADMPKNKKSTDSLIGTDINDSTLAPIPSNIVDFSQLDDDTRIQVLSDTDLEEEEQKQEQEKTYNQSVTSYYVTFTNPSDQTNGDSEIQHFDLRHNKKLHCNTSSRYLSDDGQVHTLDLTLSSLSDSVNSHGNRQTFTLCSDLHPDLAALGWVCRSIDYPLDKPENLLY